METVTKIRNKARSNLKTIVLPEYDDSRVVEASSLIEKEGIAKVILLSKDKIIAEQKEEYIREFYELRKAKGIDMDSVRKMFNDPLYYAAMMSRHGDADGFVAGANHTTSDVARAAILSLGINERISIACSCFIMVVPNCAYGENGTFVFADCGIIPDPNPRQIACIALATADLMKRILDLPARVALLSYSTKGSAKGKSVEKISEALKILKEADPDLIVDGELQVDAAIIPEVAKIKCPQSQVAGQANILIFPDLEAGNIAYKLVQRLSNARALGPLILGLNKPCSDLSRGCSVEDVVDCVAATAVRAQ